MWRFVAALVAAQLAFGTGAGAQEWPARTITMVNPFAAGGPNDVLARLFAQRMGEILGQQIIIENVGGAGGMNGADRVAKAAPDGYTFLLGTVGTQAQNQTLFKKPAYNSVTDFAPVALMVEAPLVLVARKDLPVKDMKEFVAYGKAHGAKMQYASAGTGSAIHLGCALVNMVTGLDIVHVPYRGAKPRDAGPDGRPRRLSLRYHHHGQAAGRRRQGEGHRHPDQRTVTGAAQRSHRHRAGL
jgi:tripartite-type tricarboxylate transporter receptor subunit TctC